MKELINISGQQFYYSTIDEVIGRSSQKEKGAVIIDESYLRQFLTEGGNMIKETCQIIVISENVDSALSLLKGINVLLIAAETFEEGARIAIFGNMLSNKVICIPKEDEKTVNEILQAMGT